MTDNQRATTGGRKWEDVRAEAVESGKINEEEVARLRDGQWRLAKLIEEDPTDG